MIAYDSDTCEEALDLLRQNGKVWYSDHFLYSAVVTELTELAALIQRAVARDDIAVVASSLRSMESQSYEKKMFVIQRRKQEIKDIREWARLHPEKVAKVVKQDELREEKLAQRM